MLEEYRGYIKLDDNQAAKFYSKQQIDEPLYENEYIIIGDDVYCYQNGFFRRVDFPVIDNAWSGTLKPRNIEQKAAMDMVLDEKSAVKLITGTWGTGKTLILVTAALKAIEEGRFDKIVWIRNNVQVKDSDALGALPGSELEKMIPYVMPMADHCGGIDGIERLIDRGTLEVIPLGFLRGRSIRNAVIISSEAENLTKEHIQLLMGRVDEGSNLWLDADVRQRDRVNFEKSKGIETMIERLAGEELFAYVHLIKSERSATAALADKLN